MFARVTYQDLATPEELDERIRDHECTGVPEARRAHGFIGAYLLADRQRKRTISITLWETETGAEDDSAYKVVCHTANTLCEPVIIFDRQLALEPSMTGEQDTDQA